MYYKDYFEVHSADYEEYTRLMNELAEWQAYEWDMAATHDDPWNYTDTATIAAMWEANTPAYVNPWA